MAANTAATVQNPAELSDAQLMARLLVVTDMIEDRKTYPVGSAKRHVILDAGIRCGAELLGRGTLGERANFYMEEYAKIAAALATNLRAQIKRNTETR